MNDCQEWTRSLNSSGYGRTNTKINGQWKRVAAHRLAFCKHYNLTVHELETMDLHVLHTCDNPRCVNPKHLFLGTHQDNMQDCKQKGRMNRATGSHNGNAKLTEDQRQTIIKSTEGSVLLAKRYGVHRSTIAQIRRQTK